MYCRFFGYDLEMSGDLLTGLAEMAGTDTAEELRRNQIDALYFCLRAHKHLPSDRRQEMQIMVGQARQQRWSRSQSIERTGERVV